MVKIDSISQLIGVFEISSFFIYFSLISQLYLNYLSSLISHFHSSFINNINLDMWDILKNQWMQPINHPHSNLDSGL